MATTTGIEAFKRRRAWSVVQVGGLGILIACGVMWLLPGHAYAQGEAVTIPNGSFTDGQTITVTGSGFPARSALPSGLEIIECSEPGGLIANQPTDPAADCDGTTVSGGQINTDASGNFTAQYPIELLNSGNSSINCDATDFCVLWVGEDYNDAFLSGPHAFSTPFEIMSTSTSPTTTEATTTTTSVETTTTEGPTTTTTTTTTTPLPTTTTTSTPPVTTTTTEAPTTTTSSSTTTTSSSTTTTTSQSGSGTTTTQAVSTAGTGAGSGGSGTVAASSDQLAFTGAPPFLPWLAGFGLLMSVVGLLGRRLISDGPV